MRSFDWPPLEMREPVSGQHLHAVLGELRKRIVVGYVVRIVIPQRRRLSERLGLSWVNQISAIDWTVPGSRRRFLGRREEKVVGERAAGSKPAVYAEVTQEGLAFV